MFSFKLERHYCLIFVEKGPNGPKLIQIKNKFNELECLIIAVKLHRTITMRPTASFQIKRIANHIEIDILIGN